MIFKVKKKLLGVFYSVDICEYESNIFRIKGWLFSQKYPVQDLRISVKAKNQTYAVPLTTGIKRTDVYREIPVENAKKSGFFAKIVIENLKEFEAWLVFRVNGIPCKYGLGKFASDAKIKEHVSAKVENLDTKELEIDFVELINSNKKNWSFKEEYYQEVVDIILPIYNGYQFLERLFTTIEQTKIKYRMIVVNDCSSDERISPFLRQYAQGKENVRLIENETNLGFVRSVNKGLELSKGHVVLVNSDVEFPNLWLERLILPILENENVASATPYTNCGIITSFPEIGQDNELMEGLSLDEIDEEFQKIAPRYLEMPTGVGFCMAMNRKAIEEIGVFDAESFGMGYSEENDWCQRAMDKGYRNVHVENLFVYHKHGGSFLSEDKKKYMKEHLEILLRKHPDYNRQVARFFAIDENKDIRKLAKFMLIIKSRPKKMIAALDHDLGGGASSYLSDKRNLYVDDGCAFFIIRYDSVQNYYTIYLYYKKETIRIFVEKQKEILKVLKFADVDELWINELVPYPHLYTFMDYIQEYVVQNRVYLKMLLHDYFAICPMVNLLNERDRYCNLTGCESCLEICNPAFKEEYTSIEKWRMKWQSFLRACNSIIVFSDSSKKMLERVYGVLPNVELIPHQIGYMPKVHKKYKITNVLTIGLLGVLTKHKGAEIVKELVSEIEKKKLNIKITLIGTSLEKIKSPVFSETGRYTRDSIPYLTRKQDIDVFLIPSIWPETFSYTAEEVMKMEMPVICFDIGAPAERVKKYEKGTVLSEMTAKAVLNAVKKNELTEESQKLNNRNRQVLFVVEEKTFSSRYRVEHLREQLLVQGVSSKCAVISQASKCNLREFHSVVVYRISQVSHLQKLVNQAHRLGKSVYYDMDDFIFEYEEIRNLVFLQGEDYKNFEKYSADIKLAMSICDGYIVSTEALKQAVEKSFPGKPVYINRNVASQAMFICSENSRKKEQMQEDGKIYLGYFSGTKTHNEDFESIENQLIEVMKRNEKVCLLIGGQIQLSEAFEKMDNRMERLPFVSWRSLPHLIAKADINLMPLEDTEFHNCKSENKWMEAALVGVPTVASWNGELERVISDGVDGYLCKSKEDWEENLQKLIDDADLRRRIAEAAREKVWQDYTTLHMEQDVLDALIR